jgi:uncharacterized protein (DUF1499 family)
MVVLGHAHKVKLLWSALAVAVSVCDRGITSTTYAECNVRKYCISADNTAGIHVSITNSNCHLSYVAHYCLLQHL